MRGLFQVGHKVRMAMAALVVMAVVVGVGSSAPSAATVANQNYIRRVYNDFLLRDPDVNELAWWEAYLNGGSRTTFMNNVLSTTEFRRNYVLGIYIGYLRRVPTPSEMSTQLAALSSTGDHVATEVNALASSTFYTAAGGTNAGWVTALYNDTLHRDPDAGGLSYWTGQLAAGQTRSYVARFVIRASESSSKRVAGFFPSATTCADTELSGTDSLESGSYCIVLDRVADAGGAAYWAGVLGGTGQLPSLWASLAASGEYFNDSQ